MTAPTTIDELRALQLERLRETVRTVYERVSHYTRVFDEVGVHPDVFPSQIEEQILRIEGLTPHYVCVLTRPGRLDALTVRVEALDTFAAGDAAARLGVELVERVRDTVGVGIEVDVVAPGTFERSQGKAKRIDDRR